MVLAENIIRIRLVAVGGIIDCCTKGGRNEFDGIATGAAAHIGRLGDHAGLSFHRGLPTFFTEQVVRHEAEGHGALGHDGELLLRVAGVGTNQLGLIHGHAFVDIEPVVVQTKRPFSNALAVIGPCRRNGLIVALVRPVKRSVLIEGHFHVWGGVGGDESVGVLLRGEIPFVPIVHSHTTFVIQSRGCLCWTM